MNTRYKIFSKGCLDVIPLLIPVVPFGVIFGVIGIESGLGPTVTFLMSIIIFAGSKLLTGNSPAGPPNVALFQSLLANDSTPQSRGWGTMAAVV